MHSPTFSSTLGGGEDVVQSVGLDGVSHRFPFNDPDLVRGERGGGRGEGGGVRADWALAACVQVRCLHVWLVGTAELLHPKTRLLSPLR